MDNKTGLQCRVKPIFAYLKESLKFYDLDKSIVAQLVFVIQLAVTFGGYLLARPFTQEFLLYFEQLNTKLMEQVETKNFDISFLNSDAAIKMMNAMLIILGIFFVIKAVTYLVGIYYGSYYFYSLTNPNTTWSERNIMFFKKLFKIIVFNIVFYLVFALCIVAVFMVFGILSIFLPAFLLIASIIPFTVLVVDLLFVFKNLLIIEFDVGVLRNFKKSADITKGCKKRIVFNGLWPYFMSLILSTLAVDIKNPILSLFIVAFFEEIIQLISQRLIVLMFIDAALLERKDKKLEQVKNPG